MKYKNSCKFGLYVKDLDRIVDISEVFECKYSETIRVLLKEHKIIECQIVNNIIPKIHIEEKAGLEKTPNTFSQKNTKKKEKIELKEKSLEFNELKMEE